MIRPRGVRRSLVALTLVSGCLVLLQPTAGATLPNQPAQTPMVNETVRAIAQVDGVLWIGGSFTQVKTGAGLVLDSVRGLAAFDSTTGAYRDIAPALPGDSVAVRDLSVYGDDLVVGGRFRKGSTQRNLVMIDGRTGATIRWFDSPANWTVLAARDLGRIYAAGSAISAFATSGPRLWTKAPTTYASPPGHNYSASHRDLLRDGSVIWSACICDSVAGAAAKGIVKLSLNGDRMPFPVTESTLDKNATGYAVASDGVSLYLAAGGSDALWKLSKTGQRLWRRDTSGSAQTVAMMDGKVVVGGHFLYVANATGDRCGFRSSDPDTLNPHGECVARSGLAAYAVDGALDGAFTPSLSGRYNLAWALLPQGTRLHVGGEFTRVDGVLHSYYSRLGA